MFSGAKGRTGSISSGGGGGGVPLITRLLLLRASTRFVLSPPVSAVDSGAAALVAPQLRIVAHYAQGPPSTAGGPPPRQATCTPKEEAEYFEANPALHGLLTSLAARRLAERVKLRQLQTRVVQTSVRLTQAATAAAAAATAAASVDAADTADTADASVSGTSAASASRSSGRRGADYTQLSGVVAAATASFAEDAAWSSIMTPHRPQLNPWCLLPVSAEGCYVLVPSAPFTRWCERQAARSVAEPTSIDPDVRGGPMLYNDVVHYASTAPPPPSPVSGSSSSGGGDERGGYLHGYSFVLEGDVFSGSGGVAEAAAAAATAAMAATEKRRPQTSSRDNDGGDGDEGETEVASVMLWCVLSDAPVYNFMRTLTHEAVAAISYVAQRVYDVHVTACSAESSLPSDVFTALVDAAIQSEVMQPLAAELLADGSLSSRTLPGEAITVQLATKRGSSSRGGLASRPLTSSMSNELTIRRPLDLLYPHADVPLASLLLSFTADALRVLHSLLMQEERLIVVGATPQHASACVVSLLALLGPLTWVSPLVPYLPPHLAAVSGLLRTLVQSPGANQLRRQQTPTSKSFAPLPASQHVESSGFLIGSTAAIEPYLVLLAATLTRGEAAPGGGGKRAPRVWIADARTGCVGVCPDEPVARFTRPAPASEATDETTTTATACSGGGGANPWSSDALVDLRWLAPHSHDRHPTVLFGAVRGQLRSVAESNVMDAAPLDLLPAFSDELRDLLHRVATAERRRAFRRCLESVADHAQTRVQYLESLEARLARGLRQALAAAVTAGNSTVTRSVTSHGSASAVSGGFQSCGTMDSDDDDDDGTDGAVSLRAITDALTRSYSQAYTQCLSGGAAAAMHVGAAAPPPSFPVVSPGELWQVHVGLFDHMVDRYTGAYRRGLSRAPVGSGGGGGGGAAAAAVTAAGQRHTASIELAVVLVPGMDQHYALAERVAQTHLLKQFERAVLAAELVGVRHLFSGAGELHVSGPQPLQQPPSSTHGSGGSGGPERHPLLTSVRALALFALLCSRARLHYPELFADVTTDAVGHLYNVVVARWFAHRHGPPSPIGVPGAVRLMAGTSTGGGGGGEADALYAAYGGGGGSSSSSSGGGGVRGFFSKAAKAVKNSLASGGGGGGGYGGYGGGGGGGRGGRGGQVVQLPGIVACLHSLSVPSVTQLPAAPQPFPIVSYAETAAADGVSGGDRRRRHRRGGRGTASLLAPAALPPQRLQWVRQQEQQQCIALDTDFTLADCTAVLRATGNAGNGSFAASSTGAFSGGSTYVSGLGVESEMLDAIARSGGGGAGRAKTGAAGSDVQRREDGLRAMMEASLYICHTLPLDALHRFDAYAPLLCPSSPGVAAAAAAAAASDNAAAAAASVAAYMRVGLLVPTCVSMWREGEARAARVVAAPTRARPPRPPATTTQPSTPSAAPAAATPSAVSQDSLWSLPAAAPPMAASSAWGAFNSGAPLELAAQQQQQQQNDGWDDWGARAPRVVVSVLPASTPVTTAVEQTHPSISGSGGAWSTGAPLAPPMSLSGLALQAPALSPATPAVPLMAPAPRDVMDELFADVPVRATAPVPGGHPQTQTLDDFF
ncbi:DENN (AEX-3) domain containing protein [Novymonas esmeraldas]|uniref:DENN (AEX-3) domain containing protein n=1 Tax=Novymonas esmeraldas TaxID=1808958 RepID=A0AAW0F8V4_9TRYP